MSRGRTLLLAQARRRQEAPLGPAPAHLGPPERDAWHEIVAVCPPVLARPDELALELAAGMLVVVRAQGGDRETLRLLYRMLGQLLMPMRARRRLIFPQRAR